MTAQSSSSQLPLTCIIFVAPPDRSQAGGAASVAANGPVATAGLMHGTCFMEQPETLRGINDNSGRRATYGRLHPPSELACAASEGGSQRLRTLARLR